MTNKWRAKQIVAWTLLLMAGAVTASFVSDNAFANKPSPSATPNSSHSMTVGNKSTNVHRGNHRQGRFRGINVVSEAAVILQVKPIDIMNAMIAGKKLGEVATDKGLTQAEFLDQLTKLETTTIHDALKAGTIPQEQADALIEGMHDRLMSALELTAVDVSDPSQNAGMSM